MKIIVDKMPSSASECLFANYAGNGYFDCMNENCVCTLEDSGCNCLKPIVDLLEEKE